MNLKSSGRHAAGFVEMFELFEVGDLFGEEVGVVQIAGEVEQVFLGLDVIHAFLK